VKEDPMGVLFPTPGPGAAPLLGRKTLLGRERTFPKKVGRFFARMAHVPLDGLHSMKKTLGILIFAASLLQASLHAQTTAFTYQGHLVDAGQPANGNYDIRFTLKTALSGGATVGTPQTADPVAVSEGLFTAILDFGGVPYAARELSAASATTADSAGSLSGTLTGANIPAGTFTVSLHTTGTIWSGHSVIATSDARIKTIQGRSDAAADLRTLLGLHITDYAFKDPIANGHTPQKRVIAQQVEQVYPQAVNRVKGVVPDLFQKAAWKDGWVLLKTALKTGERVRLIDGQDKEEVVEVLEVGAAWFRTSFAPKGGEVFVYGREVDDFRIVDYDALSMLNVSATQELARRLAAAEAENAALKRELPKQAARDAALEARLSALENAPSVDPSKVVLKK